MSENNEKFKYTYSAPTEDERREIIGIRKNYLQDYGQSGKIALLRKLDGKVKNAAMIAALTCGIAGCLLFGLGMSMVLVWNMYVWGIVVAAIGIVPMALAYSVHKFMIKRGKRKYGEKILELSEEILNEQNKI